LKVCSSTITTSCSDEPLSEHGMQSSGVAKHTRQTLCSNETIAMGARAWAAGARARAASASASARCPPTITQLEQDSSSTPRRHLTGAGSSQAGSSPEALYGCSSAAMYLRQGCAAQASGAAIQNRLRADEKAVLALEWSASRPPRVPAPPGQPCSSDRAARVRTPPQTPASSISMEDAFYPLTTPPPPPPPPHSTTTHTHTHTHPHTHTHLCSGS
jgi:hypothetical protein